MIWKLETCRFENRWSDVDIGDDLRDCRAALEELRTMHNHRHTHRLFVSSALINQPMLPKREAVVAHENNQRGLKPAFHFE